jgi:hypothetical protein
MRYLLRRSMRAARPWIVALSLLEVSLSPYAASAAPLRLQDVKELLAKKYSEDILIARIRAGDVGFEVNNDVLDVLRASGASDRVLLTLLEQSAARKSASHSQSDAYEAARAAVQRGDLNGALDALQAKERRSQLTGKERLLRSFILVRLGDLPSAEREVEALRRSTNPRDQAYAARALQYLTETRNRRRTLGEALELLGKLQVKAAEAKIAELSLPPDAALAARGQLLLLKGEVIEARSRFSEMRPSDLRDKLLQRADEWRRILARMETAQRWYYTEASAMCINNDPYHGSKRFPEPDIDFNEIGELILARSVLTPLAPDTIDKRFHWLLVTGDYNELLEFGRMALSERGELRIPFVASDRRFNLVIDAANKRLYVDDVAKPAILDYWNRPRTPTAENAKLHLPLQFSSIEFSEIRQVEQAARKSMGGGPVLQWKAYALRINGEMTIPEWLFMPWSNCLLGEVRQKQSTRNLAQFLIDVGDLKLEKSDLVEVKGGSGVMEAAVMTTLKTLQASPELLSGDTSRFSSSSFGPDIVSLFEQELRQIQRSESERAATADQLAAIQIENSIEELVLLDTVAGL